MQYTSPDITGHEETIRQLVIQFLDHAATDPDFKPVACVHQAVVYVMEHKPASCPRVDGSVIEPLLVAETKKAIEAGKPGQPVPVLKRWVNKIFRR